MLSNIFLCEKAIVYDIPVSTTATIVDGKCEMSPPCDNFNCEYCKGDRHKTHRN
jgi:hypothetical protein